METKPNKSDVGFDWALVSNVISCRPKNPYLFDWAGTWHFARLVESKDFGNRDLYHKLVHISHITSYYCSTTCATCFNCKASSAMRRWESASNSARMGFASFPWRSRFQSLRNATEKPSFNPWEGHWCDQVIVQRYVPKATGLRSSILPCIHVLVTRSKLPGAKCFRKIKTSGLHLVADYGW